MANLTGVPWDRVKSKKKPVTRRVPIALDSDWADELDEAKARLTKAQARLDVRTSPTKEDYAELAEAQEAVDALEARREDCAIEFVFRSIGRPAFEDLVGEHPATKAQKEQAKKEGNDDLTWNPETFPQALVHASLVSPENMSEEDVTEMWDSPDWNQAELISLFYGALEVNQSRRMIEVGKGLGTTQSSE